MTDIAAPLCDMSNPTYRSIAILLLAAPLRPNIVGPHVARRAAPRDYATYGKRTPSRGNRRPCHAGSTWLPPTGVRPDADLQVQIRTYMVIADRQAGRWRLLGDPAVAKGQNGWICSLRDGRIGRSLVESRLKLLPAYALASVVRVGYIT
jgi:hypothetical protein